MVQRWVRVGAAAAAAGLLAVCGWAGPAASEDSAPPRPGQTEYSCQDPIAGLPDSPPGTIREFPPGVPSPVPGVSGKYVCVGGRWVWIGPTIGPMGPVYMVGAPELTIDEPTVTVPEGTTATNSGFVGDGGTDPVVLGASIGTVTSDALGNWTWSYDTTDGPAQSQQVLITADAAGRAHVEVFDLVVEDVAPTVTAVTPDATTALVGQTVTFTGTATDPSSADTAAGFTWSFDGAPATSAATTSVTYDACGTHTVSATATDVDGATSAPVTSAPVTVVQATVGAPLATGSYNAVKAGQVVPVRLEVGCGAPAAGLAPRISVLSGDVDPATASDDPTLTVPFTSSNGADTSGVMRAAGDAYVYALRVPSAAPGSLFTVRIRPFEGSSAAVSIVLTIRK